MTSFSAVCPAEPGTNGPAHTDTDSRDYRFTSLMVGLRYSRCVQINIATPTGAGGPPLSRPHPPGFKYAHRVVLACGPKLKSLPFIERYSHTLRWYVSVVMFTWFSWREFTGRGEPQVN